MLENGQPRAYGPKDDVLRETTTNYPQLVQGQQSGRPTGASGAALAAPAPAAKET
jgi:hypothetical protein